MGLPGDNEESAGAGLHERMLKSILMNCTGMLTLSAIDIDDDAEILG